jgi:N-methylhydantoinase A
VADARLGVDVGGTFTDLVAIVAGDLVTAKVPSSPADQSEGAMQALAAAQLEPGDVVAFAHGMTVATNALLERRGARTALVTTEGFRDVLEIGRQNRPSLYDLTADRLPALVPRDLRFTVRERVGPEGEIEPLDPASVERAVEALRDADVESVAVCLLFAFRHPEHERAVGDAVRSALAGVHVSLSSEVLPEFREYERFATTAADAYLTPRIADYLRHLAERAHAAEIPRPLVMRSSGGLEDLDTAAERAASCVLSGPAGGVVGAAYAAAASGFDDVLTFDMGGTSTDVAPVRGREAETTTAAVVAGVPLKLPMVDVHTVSAGGGSIAWADAGGALRVGPHSAGADPGPAAYERGGEEPTVTDANLLLGYLDDGANLGGEVVLRREAAERALAAVGRQLGVDVLETALGIVRVADAEMVRALRVISVQRGLDPRDFALVAFGGAGGMHACALAEELSMDTVLAPRAGGVLSAFGLAISDLRRDDVTAWLAPLGDVGREDLERAFAGLEAVAGADLQSPRFQRRADLRYRLQSYELTVDAGDPGALAERFAEAHERRYGYRVDGEPIELVNLRLTTTVAVPKPQLHEAPAAGPPRATRRRANFDGEWIEVEVLDRGALGAGSEVTGPAVVEFPESTCVVRSGWGGAVDDAGTLVLRREARS